MTQPAQLEMISADQFSDVLEPGTTLMRGQYEIEEFLASGGFGITYLARNSLNRHVVIKECFPAALCHRTASRVHPRSSEQENAFRSLVELFAKEARRLARLNHPNIVAVHQVFEDLDTSYMCMEFVEGRDLLTISESRSSLRPEALERMTLKILDAIQYVHDAGLLHRDISPDNILLRDDGEPVLIDFGAASDTVQHGNAYYEAMLTVKDGYSPQEFYTPDAEQYLSSDLYSLGATLYHLITGDPPPNAQTRMAAIAAGATDPCAPVFGTAAAYSPTFLRCIDKALSVFAKDRFQSASEWRKEIAYVADARFAEAALQRIAKAAATGGVVAGPPDMRPRAAGRGRIKSKALPTDPAKPVEAPSRSNAELLRGAPKQPKPRASRGGLFAGASAAGLIVAAGAAFFLIEGPRVDMPQIEAAATQIETTPLGDPVAASASPELAEARGLQDLMGGYATDTLPTGPIAGAGQTMVPTGIAPDASVMPAASIHPGPLDDLADQSLSAPGADQFTLTRPYDPMATAPETGAPLTLRNQPAPHFAFPVISDLNDPLMIASIATTSDLPFVAGERIVAVNGVPLISLDQVPGILSRHAALTPGIVSEAVFDVVAHNGVTRVETVSLPLSVFGGEGSTALRPLPALENGGSR